MSFWILNIIIFSVVFIYFIDFLVKYFKSLFNTNSFHTNVLETTHKKYETIYNSLLQNKLQEENIIDVNNNNPLSDLEKNKMK
jgi:hypothetical protein